MADFRTCMLDAVARGVISNDEASELIDHFDERYGQLKLSMPEGEARRSARDAVAREMRAQAAEIRRRTKLADGARIRMSKHLQGYRNLDGKADVFEAALSLLEHNGLGMTESVKYKTDAIIGLAHGKLSDVMKTFRRSRIMGRRTNLPKADDLVDALFGEGGKDPDIDALAGAVSGVFEDLRQRFNAAGGAIGKLDKYGLPQSHDQRRVLAAGRDAWKAFVRERLDRSKMIDALTGEVMSDSRLDQVLGQVWNTIATDGAIDLKPSMTVRGKGMLASQRAEHRFLIFKDAKSWREYAGTYGEGDPIRAIFGHINGMAHDIAAMEVLGPNPDGSVEWLSQIARMEHGKATVGQPSLFDMKSRSIDKAIDAGKYADWRLKSVYQYLRGGPTVSSRMAAGVSSARNLLTSAQLGSASLIAAATDPFFDSFARYLSGLPVLPAFGAILKTFSGSTRDQAVRAGIIWDDFLHIMGDRSRYEGMIAGTEWSKWFADRTMSWSALSSMTQARRHLFALEYMGALADQAAHEWDAVDPTFRRWMEGYGIDRTDWNVIRGTPKHQGHFIRPADIAALADGPALPDVQKRLGITERDQAIAEAQTRAGVTRTAEKVLQMIYGQTERAVPSGTVRSRSLVTGAAERGTVAGELLNAILQYKAFGLSVLAMQLQAVRSELHQGAARGAGYAAALLLATTLGGSIGLQLRSIANGKDPEPMDNPSFWIRAAQTGGGWGIVGDFLLADVSRFGHSLQTTLLGPLAGLVDDAQKLTLGNAQEALAGKKTNAARELVDFAGRYTPIFASLWATRAAYRRMILDQLNYLVDPDAHKRFREQAAKLKREQRQEFWWPPGEAFPRRAPRAEPVP